jgi:hypothetical protein
MADQTWTWQGKKVISKPLKDSDMISFVGTYMETHAEQLMFENISKNMSDSDE